MGPRHSDCRFQHENGKKIGVANKKNNSYLALHDSDNKNKNIMTTTDTTRFIAVISASQLKLDLIMTSYEAVAKNKASTAAIRLGSANELV